MTVEPTPPRGRAAPSPAVAEVLVAATVRAAVGPEAARSWRVSWLVGEALGALACRRWRLAPATLGGAFDRPRG